MPIQEANKNETSYFGKEAGNFLKQGGLLGLIWYTVVSGEFKKLIYIALIINLFSCLLLLNLT